MFIKSSQNFCSGTCLTCKLSSRSLFFITPLSLPSPVLVLAMEYHAVPPEERARDEKGNLLPWGYVYKEYANSSCSSSIAMTDSLPVNLAIPDDQQKNQDPSEKEEMLDTIMPAHEHELEHLQSERTPMSPNSDGYSHNSNRMKRRHMACQSQHHHPASIIHASRRSSSRPSAYCTDTKARTTSGKSSINMSASLKA